MERVNEKIRAWNVLIDSVFFSARRSCLLLVYGYCAEPLASARRPLRGVSCVAHSPLCARTALVLPAPELRLVVHVVLPRDLRIRRDEPSARATQLSSASVALLRRAKTSS